MTHICVGNLIILGSDNGLSPGRRQAIIWTNAGILLIGPFGTNFSEILIGIQTFSFKKIHLKMSSAKWRPFCLGLNVLRYRYLLVEVQGQFNIHHHMNCWWCPGDAGTTTSADIPLTQFVCNILISLLVGSNWSLRSLCMDKRRCGLDIDWLPYIATALDRPSSKQNSAVERHCIQWDGALLSNQITCTWDHIWIDDSMYMYL